MGVVMAILRDVDIATIQPNPWRDGTGNATWDSVATSYGYAAGKLEELTSSLAKNDFWEGVIGRPLGDGVQIAFGHHRVEAARRAGIKSAPIIVRDLTDEQMLSFMANENSTAGGANFPLGVMNPIEAVLSAYAAGVVDLTPDPKTPHAQVARQVADAKPFTLVSLARILGWMRSDRQAQEKVGIAVDLLDYERQGIVHRERLLSLRTIVEAAVLRDALRATIETARAEAAEAKPKAPKAAKKAPTEPTGVAEVTLTKTRTTVAHTVEPAARSAEKLANDILDLVDTGTSYADAMKEVGVKAKKRKDSKAKKTRAPFVFNASEKEKAISNLDRLYTENAKWTEILKAASSQKIDQRIVDALNNLSKRAANRAMEYAKAGGL